jgi:hypothetical protein
MKPKDAYRTEKDFAIRGRHLMRVEKRLRQAELTAARPCWLLIGNDTRERLDCETVAVAARIHERQRDSYDHSADIPELFGLVVSKASGAVDYWIAPNGGVWSVTYLGKLEDKALAAKPLQLSDLR